mgnify:CR=1 FL=1
MTSSLPETMPGATAKSPWRLPLRAWAQVGKRVWLMIGFHEVGLLAAGVAFFTFLALTPLLAATVMTFGLIGDVAMVRAQMARIVEVVPGEAAQIIEDQLMSIVSTASGVTGIALAIALFFALYGSMRAANGMISALNIINHEHETRNILVRSAQAAALTLAAILIALTGIISGGVFAWLQTQADFMSGSWTPVLFKSLTWLAAIILGSSGFALIMRWGPDRRPAKWSWLSPGSLLATILWIIVSFGFSLYVAYISDYNAMYGSLSAIVVFLMWLFLSAYAVLLGALLNAEIERQITRDTTVGPDRPAGQRGAVLADFVETPAASLASLEAKRLRRSERRRAEAGDPENVA